jgi:hypothetical protein
MADTVRSYLSQFASVVGVLVTEHYGRGAEAPDVRVNRSSEVLVRQYAAPAT